MNGLTDKEKKVLPEIIDSAMRLPVDKQELLMWFVRGMLCSGEHDKEASRTSV